METCLAFSFATTTPPLETFLRGMETGPLSSQIRDIRGLETFLRGMETSDVETYAVDWIPLETFLRGMETILRDLPIRHQHIP